MNKFTTTIPVNQKLIDALKPGHITTEMTRKLGKECLDSYQRRIETFVAFLRDEVLKTRKPLAEVPSSIEMTADIALL